MGIENGKLKIENETRRASAAFNFQFSIFNLALIAARVMPRSENGKLKIENETRRASAAFNFQFSIFNSAVTGACL